jgi:peroxin-19
VPHGPAPPPLEISEPDFDDDDFALQLQKGMEQLMREMETSPSARNEFEQLVKSMSDATTGPGQPSKTPFTETLSRTMERMQESEIAADQARDEAASQSETDAFLAEMVKQLTEMSGQIDGSAAGGEEGMAKLLEGMMEQLMSKDILYEPMKDLQERVMILKPSLFNCSILHGWSRIKENCRRRSMKLIQPSIPTLSRS